MAHFSYEGHRLAYTVHGEGPRTTVLMPGLLLSQKMQAPLARNLAERGNKFGGRELEYFTVDDEAEPAKAVADNGPPEETQAA